MFEVLLKKKIEIELQICAFQRTYLALLKQRIQPIEFTDKNNETKAAEIISEKIERLESIEQEYLEILKQHKQVSTQIAEAREVAEEIEAQLDFVAGELEIEIPDDLRKPINTESPQSKVKAEPEYQSEEQEQQEEASFSYREYKEEEESIESDKENGTWRKSSSPVTFDSGEYFSPNIQIQKSFGTSSSGCFTPALKSQSKVPRFKRNL